MTELKPCPFCGEKDLIDYGVMGGTMEGFDYVQCANCGAEINAIHNGNHIEAVEAWNRRAKSVKSQPAADVVEVRHGKWIEDHEFFKCSECGYLTDYRLSNFCPDCGAKMDGKVGDDNGSMESVRR